VIAVDANGKLAVFGGHTYSGQGGQLVVGVSISSSRAGAPAASSAQSTVNVTALPLDATGGFTFSATDGTAFSNPGTTVEWAGPWAAGYPVITSHDPEALADIVRAAAPVAAGT